MAYELLLPAKHKSAHWKVKVRDRERVEPPHVTLLNKTRVWRIGLRERAFLDKEPPPKEVPRDLVDYVLDHLPALIAAWNLMYPENPVEGER